ncbi:NTP transferase domain-containing protein [Rhodopila sp.]|jgi:choline kinase|uniref:NTP transferase domain-containing protein n=1 Tax=Rhodopila sp. TaxID=2480087 RepID=UPI002BA01E2B|nr:NTP transferase domain-containing protein [Rhodopila sp.]HVZ10562.1 NTP transferase domain-containing protein [Rhodopila sp.]
MRGLILAAGQGAFAQAGLPPVMTALAGKTLLERQIAALRAGGVAEIGVVRGYCADAIVVASEVTWFDHLRWKETGDVTALHAASEWLRGGTVIVCDANIFYRHELVHMIGTVRGALVVGYDRKWGDLWARRFSDPLAHVAAFRRGAAGNLMDIGGVAERPAEVQGQPMGVVKFTPTAWQAAETLLDALGDKEQGRLDMTALLRQLLQAKTVAVGTVGTDGQCGRIDSADDLALYEHMVATGELVLEG